MACPATVRPMYWVHAGAEEAADQVEEGADRLAEGVEQAGDQVADAVRQARDALRDAPPPEEVVEQARDAVDDAIESARSTSPSLSRFIFLPSQCLLLSDSLMLKNTSISRL